MLFTIVENAMSDTTRFGTDFYEWFMQIQADLAKTLLYLKTDRVNTNHQYIRLFIDFNRKEYSVYSLSDNECGFHSTEHGELIIKDTCTHLSYIRDFSQIDFKNGWEVEAAYSFWDWLELN